MEEATERAIVHLGGTRPAARALKISHTTMHRWRHRGYVDAEYAIALEVATENRVTRYELRPDIYPR